MGKHYPLLASLVVAVLAAGCSKGATENHGGTAAATAKPAAPRTPGELNADGISIDGATVARKPATTGTGEELEITGTLANKSAKPVDGVNLQVTFLDASGSVVGGHATQQFFQPAVAAGATQAIVLRAPALGGSVNSATAAKIVVLNRVKPGEPTDGWKPLDPKHPPAPRTVPGSTTRITADGRVIRESDATAAPAVAALAASPTTQASR